MTYEQGLVSILIVNWKSKDYLRKCLRSIEATCADLSLQIVVVDGGSFDGCGEMLAAEFPAVEFVQSPDNVGFGRSNNLGFQRVRGEYLLLLNPDTELQANALQRLLEALFENDSAGLLGPRLLNSDGTLQKSSVQALPTPLNQALRSELLMKLFPRSRLWGAHEAYFASGPTTVEAVSGACMLLRSKHFRQLKGFHPAYFMYAEDMDLCHRVRQELTMNIVHCPMAEVTHHGGGSSQTQFSHFSTMMKIEALSLYFRLNVGAGAVSRFRAMQAFSAITRLLFLLPAKLVRQSAATRISVEKWIHILKWAVRGSAPAKNPSPTSG